MSPSPRSPKGRTLFENVVLAVSVAAVAAIVAGLVLASVRGGNGEADLRATARSIGVQRSGGDLYEIRIRNVGGRTAENVVVEVTLGEETRELDILSVSKGDQETAMVVFPGGTAGTPAVRILSYHETTRG